MGTRKGKRIGDRIRSLFKRGGTGDLVCSFCGKTKDQVDRMIKGPSVHICCECVGQLNEMHDEGTFSTATAESRCSFCGKKADQVEGLFSVPSEDVYVCAECVKVCSDILAEHAKGKNSTDES